LAPLLILLAAAAPWGAVRIGQRLHGPAPRAAILVGLLILPIACLPDLGWGALGRLAPTTYPSDWGSAREVLSRSPLPGDVVSLPWSPLRRFDWNADRPVLDPAPRFLPRPTLAAGELTVRRAGELVTVAADDPRARQVDDALRRGEDLGPVLARLGVGWAFVTGQPPPGELPPGSITVLAGPEVRLYRLASTPATHPVAAGRSAVLVADAVVVLVLLGAAAGAVRQSLGSARRRPE
jgi:hypothetical protein